MSGVVSGVIGAVIGVAVTFVAGAAFFVWFVRRQRHMRAAPPPYGGAEPAAPSRVPRTRGSYPNAVVEGARSNLQSIDASQSLARVEAVLQQASLP
jgi:FlaG/FlaF family flagellin (archaellin)